MLVAGLWLPVWANAVAWRRATMWEHRPTGDLAAPGPRENWDAGDHTMHYPYQPTDQMTVGPPPARD